VTPLSAMVNTWDVRWRIIQNMAMEYRVASDSFPPVFVLSHARLDVPVFKTIPELHRYATLVVPEEKYEEYARHYPFTSIIKIPKNAYDVARGVAQARQFVLDYAWAGGHERCVILDDDITGIAMMYEGEDGKASSAWVRKTDVGRSTYTIGVFAWTVNMLDQMMDDNETVAIAGPQNRNDQRTLDAAQSLYDLNYGRMPIGFVMWDLARFRKYAGALDMRYNRHGEDLWATMTILHNGGSYGRVPSVLVSYYDEHTQSTLKTPETEHLIRRAEYDRILTEEWKDKVRVKWDLVGRFAGAAPNLRLFRDTAPFKRVQWDGTIQTAPGKSEAPTKKESTMKVNVAIQVDIADDQRVALGAVLTGRLKPKYYASRDDVKAWVAEHGEQDWATDLEDAYKDRFQAEAEVAVEVADEAEESDADGSDLI
jgi:hypothetical protein